MARLPDAGDLGARLVPQSQARFVPRARPGVEIGNTLIRAGEDQYQQRSIMARAKASNALLDHEIAAKSQAEEIGRKVTSGELNYEDANKSFAEGIAKIEQPKIEYADPVTRETLERGIKRINASVTTAIDGLVYKARQDDFRSQGVEGLDRLGKLAGMPEADIDSINHRAEMLEPLLRQGGLKAAESSKVIQTFKDQNWLNHATQRSLEAKDSLSEITALEKDLTDKDGFYAEKLDTDKRNTVLRSVMNDRIRIENRIQHEQDRREAKGERALAQIDVQLSTGVPATAAMWAEWGETVKGTPAAAEFKDRIKDEATVQAVLRKPIDQQLNYIQTRQEKLTTEGGSARDLANLNRLDNAVKANVKQMQTDPLLFNAARTGQEVPAVDLSGIGTDPNIRTQLEARMTSLKAMQKEYGPQIPVRPLLPQEASQLSSVLNQASVKDQTQIFAALRSSAGDIEAYKGIMQQIAPDAPVKAFAGLVAARNATMTLDTHWFKPNDTASGARIAQTILSGEAILNPTKTEKGDDGKPKVGLYLPKDQPLQADFQSKLGKAFAGRPDAALTAYQAVKAYYVGAASERGQIAGNPEDVDSSLVREAITATLGTVVDVNGQGEVLAPWGMEEDTFSQKVMAAWQEKAKALKLPPSTPSNIGLRQRDDRHYYVTQGRTFLLDKKNNPVMIEIGP